MRLVLAALALLAVSASADERLVVIDGVEANGRSTELWLSMTERFVDVPTTTRTWTETDLRWRELVRSRIAMWDAEIAKLETPFAPITVREQVRIVLGNQRGEDAFTHDPRTIGFDVARLQKEYGDATTTENVQRMDRFFRHEYTHLLQKAWLAEHPYAGDTPLRTALLGMWTEGLGNYYSLSERWRDADGSPTEMAMKTRAELEPRMLARLGALACAPSSRTKELTAGLSMGPFAKKWGALPVALWLSDEMRRSPEALRQFVLAGPDGVWHLAGEHLSNDARAVLREVQANATLCTAK